MKHLFYAFYVMFYASAMFVAGLFFGQFMERRWAARDRADARATSPQRVEDTMGLDEAPVGLSATNRNLPSR